MKNEYGPIGSGGGSFNRSFNGRLNGMGRTHMPLTRPLIGLQQWFHVGEHAVVEQALSDLRALDVRHLRVGVSWADYHTPAGRNWYAWMLPALAREVDVLPCFVHTPPSLGIAHSVAAPPRDPKSFADFLDEFITAHGEHFQFVELWDAPMRLCLWDRRLDRNWMGYCRMIGAAAYWAQQRGKRTALGGVDPNCPDWLNLMFRRGVMQHIDVVGLRSDPNTIASNGWTDAVERVRNVLDTRLAERAIWITHAGHSTWRHDELGQIDVYMQLLDAPVERAYWHSLYDLHPERPTLEGFHADEREYHFGVKRFDGTPKLLYRLLQDDASAASLQQAAALAKQHRAPHEPYVLITGGAGFIGCNLADRLLESGRSVLLLDNMSRPGVERNMQFLRRKHGSCAQLELADVRDRYSLRSALAGAQQVYHFAAQVAVTTSLRQPMHDFEVNARGTLNLLEELRALPDPPPLLFTSTNKVYGSLPGVKLRNVDSRYEPVDAHLRTRGISETMLMDFHSPYGCSKGMADQLVHDYARSFGLKTVVFRMSCIYGPHQCGNEDQGWVAHFLLSALQGKPITIYGDGLQVRDLLYVDDLVDAMLLAQQKIEDVAGEAFNIGGGPVNAASLLELIAIIERIHGEKVDVVFDQWRLGDQKYYTSNISKFERATGWSPRVRIEDGVQRLHEWLSDHIAPDALHQPDAKAVP